MGQWYTHHTHNTMDVIRFDSPFHWPTKSEVLIGLKASETETFSRLLRSLVLMHPHHTDCQAGYVKAWRWYNDHRGTPGVLQAVLLTALKNASAEGDRWQVYFLDFYLREVAIRPQEDRN